MTNSTKLNDGFAAYRRDNPEKWREMQARGIRADDAFLTGFWKDYKPKPPALDKRKRGRLS